MPSPHSTQLSVDSFNWLTYMLLLRFVRILTPSHRHTHIPTHHMYTPTHLHTTYIHTEARTYPYTHTPHTHNHIPTYLLSKINSIRDKKKFNPKNAHGEDELTSEILLRASQKLSILSNGCMW